MVASWTKRWWVLWPKLVHPVYGQLLCYFIDQVKRHTAVAAVCVRRLRGSGTAFTACFHRLYRMLPPPFLCGPARTRPHRRA